MESVKSINKMRSSFGNSFAKNMSMIDLQKSPKASERLGDNNASSRAKLDVMKLVQVNSIEELKSIGQVSRDARRASALNSRRILAQD